MLIKKLFAIPSRLLQSKIVSKFNEEGGENPDLKKLLQMKFHFREEQEMTPRKVVEYLDRYVIGQADAKKAIAISFRNRWRRKALPDQIRKEILPKNILMKGPTGTGKTQLAKRLANLTEAPFLRVEATKYTQIGYVGKDVSSIIQDMYFFYANLARISVTNYKQKIDNTLREFEKSVREIVYEQILSSMLGVELKDTQIWNTKLEDLKKGNYKQKIITIFPNTFEPKQSILPLSPPYPPKKAISGTVTEITTILLSIYLEKLRMIFDKVDINKQAIKFMQEDGIIFIDEIDKIAVSQGTFLTGKGVSTEGVQRDLLPLLEGTVINTKYGDVKTDHILFIVSGAFHQSKPTDLIPELLGRLPIRVELKHITLSQFIRILKQPEFNILKQYNYLMKRQGIDLRFTDEAIEVIAKVAYEINVNTQNTGVRRLHTLIQKIMEDYSFQVPKTQDNILTVTQQYAKQKLKTMMQKYEHRKSLI